MKMQLIGSACCLGLGLLLGGCVADIDDGEAVGEVASALVSESATSSSWNGTTHILTSILPSGSNITLKHLSSTGHVAVGNPDFIPAGSCRDIAYSWNTGVAQGQGWTWFESLIQTSARNGCRFAYTRSETPNTDGSYNLTQMSPTP